MQHKKESQDYWILFVNLYSKLVKNCITVDLRLWHAALTTVNKLYVRHENKTASDCSDHSIEYLCVVPHSLNANGSFFLQGTSYGGNNMIGPANVPQNVIGDGSMDMFDCYAYIFPDNENQNERPHSSAYPGLV